jgi:hypothetical protein
MANSPSELRIPARLRPNRGWRYRPSRIREAKHVFDSRPRVGGRATYLQTLAREAGREVDFDDLSKAGASQLIDELQEVSGRGASTGNGTS